MWLALMPRTILYPPSINKLLTRSFTSGVLAAAGLLVGFAPEFTKSPSIVTFSYSAYAQEFSEQQLRSYAQAVLSIEPYRQQAFADIQQVIGNSPPNIICNKPSSYGDLPQAAQTIASNYCATSKKIVESNNLSVSQFNTITIKAQSDGGLEQRIQNAMIQIQQQ